MIVPKHHCPKSLGQYQTHQHSNYRGLHFQFSLSYIGKGNGNPLQCSCLENPRDGGAWWAAIYRVAQSRTRLKRLSSSSSRRRMEKAMAPHSSTFAWKIPWTEEPGRLQSMGSLESDTTERLHFHALEKEMATHSSVLAWRIPGVRKPGGLPSMGLYRFGHDWSDLVGTAAAAEEEKKKKGYEKTFEEITVENFPNMETETVNQVQEAQRSHRG